MNKRSFLTVFLISVIFCLIATFLYLLISRGSLKNIEISETPEQANFLVLHVSSLDDKSPAIVSSWMIFVRGKSPPTIIFKELPPSFLQPGSDSDSTSLSDGLLPEQFNQFTRQLHLDLNSYFLLDDYSINQLVFKVSSKSSSTLDQLTLTELCDNFSGLKDSPLNRVTWNELIPSHMRTNLGFETFATTWENLIQSEKKPLCRVIPHQEQQASNP